MSAMLALLFGLIALIYASVGFGGGSSYTALLTFTGIEPRLIPVISLCCNIIVVTGGTIRFWRTGLIDWRKVLPLLAVSAPLAFVGGLMPLKETTFLFILGSMLLLSAVVLLLPQERLPKVVVPNGIVLGISAALGLLAAERHRLRTGAGQHVKLALEDMALATMAHLGFIAESQLGQRRRRYGNYLFGAFGRDMKTAEGERIMVVGLTGKQWQSLVEAVGMQADVQRIEAEHQLNLKREGDRFKAREAIATAVQAWVGARTLTQVAQVFDQHGVCWARYQSVEQMIEHTLPGNPMFSTVTQPGVGQVSSPSLALDFSALAREPARPAPVLGQHTEQVMLEILGLSGAEYGRLHDQGIVAGPAR